MKQNEIRKLNINYWNIYVWKFLYKVTANFDITIFNLSVLINWIIKNNFCYVVFVLDEFGDN